MLKGSDKTRLIGVMPFQKAGPIPVGKIPDDGTQVKKSGNASNTTTVLHTVTAGTTFYLSLVTLGIANWAGAAGDCSLIVTDDGDVIQYYIFNYHPANGTYIAFPISFLPPVEIPAGYKVKIVSSVANLYIYGFIHGYEA